MHLLDGNYGMTINQTWLAKNTNLEKISLNYHSTNHSKWIFQHLNTHMDGSYVFVYGFLTQVEIRMETLWR